MEWKAIDFKGHRAGKRGQILTAHRYRCGFCAGRGFMPSRKTTKCPACLGDGIIQVQPPAVICAYCNGSGKSRVNSALSCSVCHGRGVISVPAKHVEACPACKGRGREKGGNLPCLKCRGIGVFASK